MVMVAVPRAAALLAVRVKVLVLVVLLGLNEAVTPLGKPEADKLPVPLKPFWGVIAIVLVPLAPCTIVTLLGVAESAKSGTRFTVSETVVVFVKLPDVPVMVTATVPVLAVLLAVSVKV